MLTWAEIRTLLYERHNRSWSKVARTLGLSDAAVLAYRDGKSIPGFDLVDAIAAAIDKPRQEVHDALVAARVARDEKRRGGGIMSFAAPVKPPTKAAPSRLLRQNATLVAQTA